MEKSVRTLRWLSLLSLVRLKKHTLLLIVFDFNSTVFPISKEARPKKPTWKNVSDLILELEKKQSTNC